MYATSSVTKIYYEVAGEGPPILFAHGAGGNAAIWFEQIAPFSTRYTCIAFDHRCFARSPVDPASISIPQFRDDAIAVLDAVGTERAHRLTLQDAFVSRSLSTLRSRCPIHPPLRTTGIPFPLLRRWPDRAVG